MDWTISDDVVGLVLLIFAAGLALIGWQLAGRGFGKAEEAAKKTEEAAEEVKRAAAESQTALAMASDDEAAGLAEAREANTELVAQTSVIGGAIGEMNSALAELKGTFAPARVFLAFSVLAFLASLVAFDVIALDLDTGAGAGTTTTTETTD